MIAAIQLIQENVTGSYINHRIQINWTLLHKSLGNLALRKFESLVVVVILMADTNSKLPSENQLNKQYGKGFNMLKKMGFKLGEGLGPTGEGIVTPIEISMRRPGEGLKDDEGAPPRHRRKRTRAPSSKDAPATDYVPDDDDWESGSSDSSESTVTKSKEDERITEARKAVEILVEKKRELDYRLYTLREASVEVTESNSIDGFVDDIFESGILTEGLSDFSLLQKGLELLRDKHENNDLWYRLEVESFLSCFVSDAVTRRTDTEEISADIISSVRDMIIDDDHFTRILEFQLLPPPALRPNIHIYRAIKSSATSLHYQSIFSRFLNDFLIASVAKQRLSDLLNEGWIDLIPTGPSLSEFLINSVKPKLVSGCSPQEVLPWKRHFSPSDWREIVHHISLQLSMNLRKADPESSHALEVADAAISWTNVLSPGVIGLLFVESGFLPKWFEKFRLRQDVKLICKRWLPLLAKISYHSPAKKFVIDFLKSALGESSNFPGIRKRPGGPPPEFFAAATGQSVPETAKVSLADVVKEKCLLRNVSFAPKAGVRENGCQVFKIGAKNVYWKDDSIFEKVGDASWLEVSIDSLFR